MAKKNFDKMKVYNFLFVLVNFGTIGSIKGCDETKAILKSNPGTTFNSSDYQAGSTNNFEAKLLPFSKYGAWCLNKKADDPFSDWAIINFHRTFLVKGVQVYGYKGFGEKEFKNKNLPESFKIEYKYKGNDWKYADDGKEISSLKATNDVTYMFESEFVLDMVRLRMKINKEVDVVRCIKIELFGCEYIPPTTKATTTVTSTTASTEVTTQTAQTTKQVTISTLPPDTIASYSIPQGNSHRNGSFKDFMYNERPDKGKPLKGGLGCLVDSDPIVMPFKSSLCWIGWHRKKTVKPFLKITLSRRMSLSGIVLIGYADNNFSVGPVQRYTVSYKDTGDNTTTLGLRTIGYACLKKLNAQKIIKTNIAFEPLYVTEINVNFDYSNDWILLRHISLIQNNVLASENVLRLSSQAHCKDTTEEKITKESPSSKIPIIIGVIMSLLLLLIVVGLISYFKCLKKKKKAQVSKSNGSTEHKLELMDPE